jgi:signal transduction histidine kinase
MTKIRTRIASAFLYLGCWLPIFGVYTFMFSKVDQSGDGSPAAKAAAYILPGVLLGGLIWRLSARVRWRHMGWPRLLVVELVMALGYAIAWSALFYVGVGILVSWGPVRHAVKNKNFGWQLIFCSLIYLLHAAVFHSLRISRELKARDREAAESENLRVRAEMRALRGQLDPHFLFNSLHSITALVRQDPKSAEEALLQFAGLLRRVLDVNRDRAGDEVLLSEEVAFVEDYLAIERLRLGHRLRIVSDFSPEALSSRLPAFSLQPIVENAVRYAIAPRRDGGTITLHGSVAEGKLKVMVADDGPGMDPAVARRADGVGLNAIGRRLQLRHHDGASMSIETALGQGFRITLLIPAAVNVAQF